MRLKSGLNLPPPRVVNRRRFLTAIGLGALLWEGVGDTIRVSLSADPVEEVHAGFEILRALNLRHRGVNLGKPDYLGAMSLRDPAAAAS